MSAASSPSSGTVRHPRTVKDVLAMAVKFIHHKGENNRHVSLTTKSTDKRIPFNRANGKYAYIWPAIYRTHPTRSIKDVAFGLMLKESCQARSKRRLIKLGNLLDL